MNGGGGVAPNAAVFGAIVERERGRHNYCVTPWGREPDANGGGGNETTVDGLSPGANQGKNVTKCLLSA